MSEYDSFMELGRKQGQASTQASPPQQLENYVNDEVDSTPLSEDGLLIDSQFQYDAKVMYDDYNARLPKQIGHAARTNKRTVLTDPKEIATWAVDKVSMMNNNFAQMTIDYSRLRQQSPESLQSFMRVWDAYDATPLTSRQFTRGLGQTFTDPTMFMGIGLLGKAITKGLAKQTVKGHFRNMVRQMAPTIAMGAGEGALVGGAYGHADESLRSKAGGTDYSIMTPMVYSALGAVSGAGIGGALNLGGQAMKQGYKLYRGAMKADAPMDTKQLNGAPTFSADPRAAAKHGDVYEVNVESSSPAKIDADATPEEVMEQFDLEPEDVANGFDSPEFADALRDRGFDIVYREADSPKAYDTARDGKWYTQGDGTIVNEAGTKTMDNYEMFNELHFGENWVEGDELAARKYKQHIANSEKIDRENESKYQRSMKLRILSEVESGNTEEASKLINEEFKRHLQARNLSEIEFIDKTRERFMKDEGSEEAYDMLIDEARDKANPPKPQKAEVVEFSSKPRTEGVYTVLQPGIVVDFNKRRGRKPK